MNKQAFLALTAIFLLSMGPSHLVAAEDNRATATRPEIKADSAGILPTNFYYFLKEFGRGIKRILTVKPAKKIELEFAIAEQRLLEIKKLSEIGVGEDVIGQSVNVYRGSLFRIQSGLEALHSLTNKEEVIALKAKILDKLEKHREFLFTFMKENEGIFDAADSAILELDELISVLSKDLYDGLQD